MRYASSAVLVLVGGVFVVLAIVLGGAALASFFLRLLGDSLVGPILIIGLAYAAITRWRDRE